jgi:dipeptidyl aminopeptidase/acylaminoacyl peptidase
LDDAGPSIRSIAICGDLAPLVNQSEEQGGIMKFKTMVLFLVVFFVSLPGVNAQSIKRTSDTETVVPFYSQIGGYTVVSPKVDRLAVIVSTGVEKGLMVSGWRGVWFRPDIVQKSITFSPDGSRLAFVATVEKGVQQAVIVDQTEEKPYDKIIDGTLAFSPDSMHLAYVAQTGGKQFLIMDGEVKYGDAQLIKKLVFSPDSKRLAFAVESGKEHFVVADSKEEKHYDLIHPDSIVFSPDSRRLAYAAMSGIKQVVVVDGKEQVEFVPPVKVETLPVEGQESVKVPTISVNDLKMVKTLAYSPDSKRLAYVVLAGDKEFLVVDGVEQKKYDGVARPIFSPDSKRLAYSAKLNNQYFVVVDGIAGNPYDIVGPPVFSPDGSRMAYIAKAKKDWFIVVDGVEGKHYDAIAKDCEPIFSPKGNRLAYGAKKGKVFFMVVDGNEQKGYDAISSPAFSPDGKFLAYAASTGRQWSVAVDGISGPSYGGIVAQGGVAVVFDTPKRFHYLALKGTDICTVRETIQD